jgi:hypothetical protein
MTTATTVPLLVAIILNSSDKRRLKHGASHDNLNGEKNYSGILLNIYEPE